MNYSIFSQAPYVNRYQGIQPTGNFLEKQTSGKSEEMRNLLRNLQSSQVQDANPYSVMPDSKTNGFLDMYGVAEEEEDKEQVKTPSKYNYREVSMKIRQAKNSVSAGQAVISAKRKVLEVRREIAKGDGDEEELQLALAHAKQMEMAARKKKHHLELEELIHTIQKRDEHADEREDRMKESASGIQSVFSEQAQEEVSKQEDAVFEKRQELMDEMQEELKESAAQASDEMMAELGEMIAEFGEEQLKELEEEMEQLVNLEVLDQLMSEEELEKLKQKHRHAENKAMVKADMDYLKGMFKHFQEKGVSVPGFSMAAQSAATPIFSVTVDNFTSASVSSSQTTSIDIQI